MMDCVFIIEKSKLYRSSVRCVCNESDVSVPKFYSDLLDCFVAVSTTIISSDAAFLIGNEIACTLY